MKESTATAVNMIVGISMTTAEPMLVLKKVMVASQPLVEVIQELVIFITCDNVWMHFGYFFGTISLLEITIG